MYILFIYIRAYLLYIHNMYIEILQVSLANILSFGTLRQYLYNQSIRCCFKNINSNNDSTNSFDAKKHHSSPTLSNIGIELTSTPGEPIQTGQTSVAPALNPVASS